MAWNEPGRGGKDPWGGRNGKKGPPDLDELLRRFRNWLRNLRGGGSPRPSWRGILLALGVLVGLWLASGFYQIDSAERGLVMRFDAYQTTVGSGLHWHLPYPVGSVRKVNVDTIRSAGNRALMLTGEQDLVDVAYAVQYRVKDPEQFAFNVAEPEETLRQVMRAAMHRVVGTSGLEAVLDASSTQVSERAHDAIQKALDAYGTGLQVTAVNLQDVQPPEPVKAAFADVVAAREDKARMRNQAQAYASRVLPEARGEAASRIDEARAYKVRVIDHARGEASRFTQLLEAYRQAPEVTRTRLYLEAMEQVLGGAATVLTDGKRNGPVLHLPLDRLGAHDAEATPAPDLPAKGEAAGDGSTADGADDSSAGVRARTRGSR